MTGRRSGVLTKQTARPVKFDENMQKFSLHCRCTLLIEEHLHYITDFPIIINYFGFQTSNSRRFKQL